MSKYIFSGNLTDIMASYLKRIPWFKPMDVLVSQLDRSSINKMLELKKQGIVKSLFIDSGAYSQYTGRCGEIDVDEYISYVDSIDEYIYAVAQVDTLPGKFGEPKTKECYIESADKSWENYLYMRHKMKSPHKLISVFHYGEPFSALGRMLDYRDDTVIDTTPFQTEVLGTTYPDRINIVGLSPANDSAQQIKDIYLNQCYDFIKRSSYPNAKTHLFGMTAIRTLSKIPYYSADSISHRKRTAYNKIFTRKWGIISLTDASRTNRVKSNMSFIRTCDPETYKEFEKFVADYGFTIDQIRDDNAARICIDICETQQAVKNEYAYHPDNQKRSKKLFSV